jgi:hypothetical protein
MAERKDLKLQRRALTERIVERIANDQKFRRQLAMNPDRALATAGFSKELEALDRLTEAAKGGGSGCGRLTCGWRSCGKNKITCLNSCQITEKVLGFI